MECKKVPLLINMLGKSSKKVTFTTALDVIYEDPNLSEDLKLARMSDFIQRQADKARMERLLNPILSISHREKMKRMVEVSQKWLEERQLSSDKKLSLCMQNWMKMLQCECCK